MIFSSQRVATNRITDAAITVVPMAGAAMSDIAGLLVATACRVGCGSTSASLHAAAVLMPGAAAALAVAEPSGSGK